MLALHTKWRFLYVHTSKAPPLSQLNSWDKKSEQNAVRKQRGWVMRLVRGVVLPCSEVRKKEGELLCSFSSTLHYKSTWSTNWTLTTPSMICISIIILHHLSRSVILHHYMLQIHGGPLCAASRYCSIHFFFIKNRLIILSLARIWTQDL